ncbi:peptide chain release factor N(5)-glutamine methyltransferase [Rothia sp. ZJ932]|uniref:peptide chain release factor N(5)-glutamine methyltransferase n=1 Tax=Rothia sp. ZJ932 TaxID=2810516 RepID=UPI001F074974|nr:peptide chain release factor N(5)-glutamine methyltransferase [Rothia sp. ZJ932]
MTDFQIQPGEELDSALRRAGAFLISAGIESAMVDAQLLAAHLVSAELGESVSRGRVQALALSGAQVPPGFAELVSQRAQRVPLQHLTGVAYFRHLELNVGPGVFTPRPETELLVDHALNALERFKAQGVGKPVVVDLCTGSGAIAAALATEFPAATVHAVELSAEAYEWAHLNLEPLGVDLRRGDATVACEDLLGEVDAVATNPPYIPTGAVPKDPEVREHDPQIALYGGSEDGMDIPYKIALRAFELLKPGGYLVMEHAETQRELAAAMFAVVGFEKVESINDLAGKPRHTSGYKPHLIS